MDREQIRAIVREVIEAMFESSIPVGVSNRHVHLCQGLKIPNRVLFSRCKAIYWSYALPSKTQEPVGLFL